ncbi:hypothetical protein [uncultured Psychroserpens sp.]|uniref:hypothetical protein n=1 Tax=uncultured Psychroserpens sp. TaxID=255436 RepID=UPI00262F0EFB|nr:hypothetical protein [uncultured Psychroserpens sp.]
MKSLFFKILVILCLLVINYNCSDDDSIPQEKTRVQLTAEDFTISIDEHPITNGDFLGTMTTNMEANFNIVSQDIPDALTLDSQTGNISIANASVFDYEINSTIEATVNVSTSNETVEAKITINLNNLDDIEYFLTTTKQTYIDAADNTWLLITEEEYNLLSTALNNVTKSGTTDMQYDSDVQTDPPINEGLTIINNNSEIVPAGSYLFAFKYYAFSHPFFGQVPIDEAKVRLSETDIANGYYTIGSTLAPHDEGNQYFLLKGNATPINNIGYLGICESDGIGYKRIAGTNVYSNACASSDYFNKENNQAVGGLVVMYQGLSTTLKQWD